MTKWVTADLHIGHKNILKFNPATRPFKDLEEMHSNLIASWNHKVLPTDEVYIIGDVSFAKGAETARVLESLTGRIHLIRGNHDKRLCLDRFDSVNTYWEMDVEGISVCMFHFPIESWHHKEVGAVHLHGHMHGMNTNRIPRRKDVGVDATGMWLLHLEGVVGVLAREPIVSRNNQTFNRTG